MNKNKLLASAMAVALTALSTNAVADATQDLIDALVTKGVLSPNEAEILAEQHKAEAKS
ncbi:MAG: porin, partial [Methylophilaceae bacterium]|nr:porin [Methylophilaceae bacterium]